MVPDSARRLAALMGATALIVAGLFWDALPELVLVTGSPSSVAAAVRVVLVASGAAIAIGLGVRSRALLEWGLGILAWSVAIVAVDALVSAFDPKPRDLPRAPWFVKAPLQGAAIVGFGAVWGAVARRWLPWSGVWVAAAVAASVPASVLAWSNLDRTVVDSLPGAVLCRGLLLSPTDAVCLEFWWAGVAMAAATAAALAHVATSRVPERALRRAADVALACVVLLLPLATWRWATLPQPQDYAASVPVVGTTVADPARDDRLTVTGLAPPGLDGLTLEGAVRNAVSWRWSDGTTSNPHFAHPGVELALRYEESVDVWLLSQGDEAMAAFRPPDGHGAGVVHLRWADVAHRLAPPRAWVVAAALGALASLLLRRTRVGDDDDRRTLSAMRLAVVLGLSSPLLVAAVRGYVLP